MCKYTFISRHLELDQMHSFAALLDKSTSIGLFLERSGAH